MSPLRQALGAAYPTHHMDPDTVASITRGMRKIEKREKAHIIAAPMRALMDLLATGEAYEAVAVGDELGVVEGVVEAVFGALDTGDRGRADQQRDRHHADCVGGGADAEE